MTTSVAAAHYTPVQGHFFAHSLMLESIDDDSFTRSLSAARVDMNPHQVEASLFVDAVMRWFKRNPAYLERKPSVSAAYQFRETEPLWIGPPPTLSNEPQPQELEQMLRIAAKFDVAGRDERNRALGRAGEELVLAHERATLSAAGRGDLARKVRWISDEEGDGAGYDIESFTPNGKPRLLEIKTTNGWERTPFYISRNELAVAEERRETWRLLRLWNFSRVPKAFELAPPLSSHVTLTATTFQASFQ